MLIREDYMVYWCKIFKIEVTQVFFFFWPLMFNPLTSSSCTFPPFYQSANTRLTLREKEESGAAKRTEECRWTGIRTKGTEEQKVPHAPAPSASSVPALSLQQFKSSLHKLDPWEQEKQTNVQQTTATQTALCCGEQGRGHCIKCNVWKHHDWPWGTPISPQKCLSWPSTAA